MADDSSSSRAAARRAPEAADDDGAASKEALQERMEEARDSIAQTVTDIRDKVVGQYESVRETVADTLDWREQFRAHPVAWCVGAVAVGYVLSNSAAAALRGTKDDDALFAHLAAIGDRFSDELTERGMSILAPALTGTVLVPILASKINDLFGIDLSDFTHLLTSPDAAYTRPKKKAKKNGGKKGGKKGGGKAKKNKPPRADES